MLTYAAFIAELVQSIEIAKALRDRPKRNEDDEFRRWHHELIDLIDRISAKKYSVNCKVGHRHFNRHGSYTHNPTAKERMEAYNRDLDDTITELETLVTRFNKFGDPNAEATTHAIKGSNPGKLSPPDKVTPAWLWEHASIALWLQAGAVLFVAFTAGIAIGQSTLYVELVAKLGASSGPTAVVPSTPALGKK